MSADPKAASALQLTIQKATLTLQHKSSSEENELSTTGNTVGTLKHGYHRVHFPSILTIVQCTVAPADYSVNDQLIVQVALKLKVKAKKLAAAGARAAARHSLTAATVRPRAPPAATIPVQETTTLGNNSSSMDGPAADMDDVVSSIAEAGRRHTAA